MKKLAAICFALALLLPMSAHAIPVVIVGDPYTVKQMIADEVNTTAITGAIGGASSAITGSISISNALLEEILYNVDGTIGTGLAASGATPTLASAAIANMQQTAALRNETEMMRDEMVRPGQYPSVKEAVAKYRSVRSGDYMKVAYDELQKKLRTSFENFTEQFTQQALEDIAMNALDDILSCQVPQLDIITPSFNLDFGFEFCDYSQLMEDMEEQTRALSERSWGGVLTVNGTPANELFKKGNGDLLKDAIHKTSPTVGHTLALDFLSDMSTTASVKASADLSSLTKKMRGIQKAGKLSGTPRNSLNLLDDVISVNVEGTNLMARQQQTSIELQDKNLQVDVIEAEAAEKERNRKRSQEVHEQTEVFINY